METLIAVPSGFRHIVSQKINLHPKKEGIYEQNRNILDSSGFGKKKKKKNLPSKQNIVRMKFKSGLLIYSYKIHIYIKCIKSFVKTPTPVIKTAKCLVFQVLVGIIRYLYPIKLVWLGKHFPPCEFSVEGEFRWLVFFFSPDNKTKGLAPTNVFPVNI